MASSACSAGAVVSVGAASASVAGTTAAGCGVSDLADAGVVGVLVCAAWWGVVGVVAVG